jgi:hypothetical protein
MSSYFSNAMNVELNSTITSTITKYKAAALHRYIIQIIKVSGLHKLLQSLKHHDISINIMRQISLDTNDPDASNSDGNSIFMQFTFTVVHVPFHH